MFSRAGPNSSAKLISVLVLKSTLVKMTSSGAAECRSAGSVFVAVSVLEGAVEHSVLCALFLLFFPLASWLLKSSRFSGRVLFMQGEVVVDGEAISDDFGNDDVAIDDDDVAIDGDDVAIDDDDVAIDEDEVASDHVVVACDDDTEAVAMAANDAVDRENAEADDGSVDFEADDDEDDDDDDDGGGGGGGVMMKTTTK